MDGARIFNAVITEIQIWSKCYRSRYCLNLFIGLGAPVEVYLSVLAILYKMQQDGEKCSGGGMRQSGILAARIYALENKKANEDVKREIGTSS